MPQMMPINWLMSFFFFICIFLIFNIMNYYIYNINFNNINNNPSLNFKKKNLNWKW
uniref:ATP synthase complex subunit 8 n=1 Tax=Artena dotata TaxID=423528 RepID=A0A8K1X708_9NEOP|nr:ATP synthase F0 subunit 8 [Artena dotata]UHA56168.1 ATP synthase F0 subunit 8 [Artena dotata]UNP54629.1 ATP synthase F0 subunit 8 [Artena dotata]